MQFDITPEFISSQGLSETLPDKFWGKIDKSGPIPNHQQHLGRCWKWCGSKLVSGYGLYTFRRHQKGIQNRVLVHRLVWVLFNGPIPNGKWILHHCDNPACCNPDHLFCGTPADNGRDKSLKGRSNPPVGERAGNSKLTDEDVIEIRKVCSLGTVNQTEIAKLYKIGQYEISRIKNRKRWKHI